MKIHKLVMATLGVLLLMGVSARGQTAWEVVKTFQIGGQGGWDYFTVDSQTHRLFVPRSTHTRIYLPTADYEELKPGATGRPKTIPGTFKILVVAQR